VDSCKTGVNPCDMSIHSERMYEKTEGGRMNAGRSGSVMLPSRVASLNVWNECDEFPCKIDSQRCEDDRMTLRRRDLQRRAGVPVLCLSELYSAIEIQAVKLLKMPYSISYPVHVTLLHDLEVLA